MTGIFTISLDFELHWGVFDKKDRQSRITCYKNTLQLIPELVKLFVEYEVHVTWAVVGSLMAKDQQEWEQLKPKAQPDYINKKHCVYQWVLENGLDQHFSYAHFAPETVAAILPYRGQELGTHTFSHYYCMEEQNNKDAFKDDLEAAKRAAALRDHQPVSLVFPRNQFNPFYLKACREAGIKVVRSNPDNWFWTPIPDKGSNLVRKIFRTGDGYIQMGKRTSYPLTEVKVAKDEPIQLPASRLFRPWHPKYPFINLLRLNRMKAELQTAAKYKECYHLWWHPENFGDYPHENFRDLQVLLEEYKKCQKRYDMQSWNMGEYANHLSV